MKKYKRIYNLALSVYSHVRHSDYIGAKMMALELVELLDEEIKKDEEEKNRGRV